MSSSPLLGPPLLPKVPKFTDTSSFLSLVILKLLSDVRTGTELGGTRYMAN